eukprot:1676399-Rhodomonas_salina.7
MPELFSATRSSPTTAIPHSSYVPTSRPIGPRYIWTRCWYCVLTVVPSISGALAVAAVTFLEEALALFQHLPPEDASAHSGKAVCLVSYPP